LIGGAGRIERIRNLSVRPGHRPAPAACRC